MKRCRFCNTVMNDSASSCPGCGLSQYDSSSQYREYTAHEIPPEQPGQPAQPEEYFRRVQTQQRSTYQRIRAKRFTAAFFVAGIAIGAVKFIPVYKRLMAEREARKESIRQSIEDRRSDQQYDPFGGSMPAVGSDIPDLSKHFQTVAPDEYFEVADIQRYQDSFGGTTVIRKILAKQDGALISNASLPGTEGQSAGKASDRIVLSEGEYNYFRYYFPEGIPEDAEPEFSENRSTANGIGAKAAVELVEWKLEDHELFLTVRQTAEPLSQEAKFKLLFYLDGMLVGDEFGYFSMNTDALTGTGSEAVIPIMVFDMHDGSEYDYDDIEFFYEP